MFRDIERYLGHAFGATVDYGISADTLTRAHGGYKALLGVYPLSPYKAEKYKYIAMTDNGFTLAALQWVGVREGKFSCLATC